MTNKGSICIATTTYSVILTSVMTLRNEGLSWKHHIGIFKTSLITDCPEVVVG